MRNLFIIIILFQSLLTKTSNAQTLSISGSHGMAFCGDSLWSWGNLIDSLYKVPKKVSIPFQQKFIAINALSGSSYGLDTAGYVWSWGANTSGMLGIGSTTQNLIPSKVHGTGNVGFLSNIKSISGKRTSAFALANDSTVWSWGSNTTGVLGDGSYFNIKTTPVKVIDENSIPLDSIVQVSSSSEHALAVDANGNVWTWGRNYYGECGIGVTNTYQLTATKVIDASGTGYLSNVKSVAAGTTFSLALKNDGTVWSWGLNENGQLGNATINNTNLPVQVKDTLVNLFLSNIIAIQAGDGFAMALSVSGKVYVWGSNTYGQLTNQFSSSFSPIPILLHSLPSISSISIGSTTVGVETQNGEILMWGNNLTSNIGNNTNSYYVSILKPVLNETGLPLLNNVKQLAVGYDHQTALKVDGSVWTWGNHSINVYNPNDNNSILPNKIFDSTGITYLTNIKQIAVGELHNLALTTNGYAYGWGTTNNYVLGNPVGSYYYKAVAIKNNLGAYTNNVKSIAASTNASMFLHNDNTISWCGRLYLNSLNSYSSVYPSILKDTSGTVNLDSVVSIAAGLNNIYAVTQDGKVWAVGNNDYGQLGLGDNSFHYGTVLVLDNTGTQPLSNIKSISIKENSVLTLSNDGTIWAWGVNDYGQLGVGDETFSYLKRKVLDQSGLNPLSNITSTSMGEYDALALAADSTAWAWGWNVYGEACDLTFNQRLLPVKVLKEDSTILENIISVNAGTLLSSFLLADKTILSCGYNLDGQTGTKTSLGENVPSLTHLACRNDIPEASFSSATIDACINDCIQLTDNSIHIPNSWKWEIPGASPSISYNQNPTICFPQAGTYSVTLTTSNFLGTDSTTITNYITVLNNPTAAFSYIIDTLNKQITTSNTSTSSTTYQWTFGDGNSSNSSDPQHIYNNFGTYIICLTSTNSCGSNIVCDTVSIIDPLSVKNFSSDDIDFFLFPNPAKNNLILKSDKHIDSYEISNVLGEIILARNNNDIIDISFLAAGLYILSINSNNRFSKIKFVKE